MITKEEYIILKSFDNNLKNSYIARDKDGELRIFDEKPYKHKLGFWDLADYDHISLFYYFNDKFKNIKWEDEEPKKIIDYIKEYEDCKRRDE